MLQLELNDKEQETLSTVLTSYLSELKNEVRHTDAPAYREQLKSQEQVIEQIWGKVTHVAAAPSRPGA